jgi:multidrug efflux pump subunit AcrB
VNFFDLCIQRPILTLMMTLSLVVFGVLGYVRLGVDQYPDMEFPSVVVTALLEGASPEVMEEDVTDVLEEYLNTISGVHTLRSTTAQVLATRTCGTRSPRHASACRRISSLPSSTSSISATSPSCGFP